jgi:hypothetical protein
MIKDLNELLKLYEEIGGYVCLKRFVKFSSLKCDKKFYKKLMNSLVDFENELKENNMYVRKDYINFRSFLIKKFN